jgi:hypothetical protein
LNNNRWASYRQPNLRAKSEFDFKEIQKAQAEVGKTVVYISNNGVEYLENHYHTLGEALKQVPEWVGEQIIIKGVRIKGVRNQRGQINLINQNQTVVIQNRMQDVKNNN